MAEVRIPDERELRRLLQRGVAEVIPEEELREALLAGRPLRLKMGFDPTRPVVTLGWAVGLRKLRQFQDLGHTVVLIIGDVTAQIGDPSGQSETRPMLSPQEVEENAQAVLDKFFLILDRERTEVRRQSEWFSSFPLGDMVRLAAKVTVAQMLQREDFALRYAAGRPIALHEFIYPLLQAYDSVAVAADVEFGGTDQKFNILLGREIQPHYGQRPQCVFLMPLLVGLDGQRKMSQSLGNYIAIDAPPYDMYGKLMSLPDHLIVQYLELLTDVPEEEVVAVAQGLADRSLHPMEAKMRMAREVVAQFWGREAASAAEEEFVSVFRRHEAPSAAAPVAVPLSATGQAQVDMVSLLVQAGVVTSRSQARRLISQGAVDVDGTTLQGPLAVVREGSIVKVGKYRFLRIVDAGRQ
jgi:tyrosyl-tRNA synthetase